MLFYPSKREPMQEEAGEAGGSLEYREGSGGALVDWSWPISQIALFNCRFMAYHDGYFSVAFGCWRLLAVAGLFEARGRVKCVFLTQQVCFSSGLCPSYARVSPPSFVSLQRCRWRLGH